MRYWKAKRAPMDPTPIPVSTSHPPLIWRMLTRDWWRLGSADAQALWHALALSRWSSAVALRQALYHHRHGTQDVEQLMSEVLAPQACMALLEDLVTECRLARSCASRIQDRMLQQMSPRGKWL